MQVLQLTNSESVVHCRREGRCRYRLPGPGYPEGDPGPDYFAHVFFFFSYFASIIICRLYKLTLSDGVQVTLKPRVSLFDLVYRILAGPQLLEVLEGWGEKKFFHRGLEPAVSGCCAIGASRSHSSGKSTFTTLYAVKQLR
jgi:hypothetical protein